MTERTRPDQGVQPLSSSELATLTTVSVKQAAATLGCHVQTVYAAVQAGSIPAIRVGPKRIRISAVWLRGQVDPTVSRTADQS